MKRFAIALLGLSVAWTTQAQDAPKKDDAKKLEKKAAVPAQRKPVEITLKVGDAPPALKATKWMQGAEVASLEKGKVYVVEFWATWCGPCIVMMPHLGELQREYKDKGVTVIGYSAQDNNNTEEKVQAFVAKRGEKLGYTFAFADNRDTYKEWMQAAGRNGIPCTFVVDKTGKIAYIGHPMYLDVVLPKVVDGTWDIKADGEKLKEIETEVNAVFKATSGSDAAAGLKTLTEFETKHPELGSIPYFVSPKIRLLLKGDKKSEALAFANKVIDKAAKSDDSSMLGGVASVLTGPDAKKDEEMAKMGLAAAEKMFAIVGEKDLGGNMTMARVLFANGKVSKAKEFAQKTLDLAPDASKKAYSNMLKPILEGGVQ